LPQRRTASRAAPGWSGSMGRRAFLSASSGPRRRGSSSAKRRFGTNSGEPFGAKLAWMAQTIFMTGDRVAIAANGVFCFPGYNAAGVRLPPPRVCAATMRQRVGQPWRYPPDVAIGGYAQGWHLGGKVGRHGPRCRVARSRAARCSCLPHPSWPHYAWLKPQSFGLRPICCPGCGPAVQEVLFRLPPPKSKPTLEPRPCVDGRVSLTPCACGSMNCWPIRPVHTPATHEPTATAYAPRFSRLMRILHRCRFRSQRERLSALQPAALAPYCRAFRPRLGCKMELGRAGIGLLGNFANRP